MSLEEAIAYFVIYGNVLPDSAELMRTLPSLRIGQLRAAADYALTISKRPKTEVDSALVAIIWQ